MAATIIDGAEIAQQVRAEVLRDVQELQRHHGVVPGLAAVLIGENPASASYVRSKERACQEVASSPRPSTCRRRHLKPKSWS